MARGWRLLPKTVRLLLNNRHFEGKSRRTRWCHYGVVGYLKNKKIRAIGLYHKGQFSKIRYISKEVCRILRLWLQMQCLSGKLTSYR